MKTTKIFTLVIVVIFTLSCKKDNQNNSDIIYTRINKTLTIATSNEVFELDIDKDGVDDLSFNASTYYNSTNLSNVYTLYIYSLNDSVELVERQLSIPWKSNNYSYFVVFNLFENYIIQSDPPSGCYWRIPIRPAASVEIKIKDTLSSDSTYFKTFTTATNTYIAVKIKNNVDYFGWIRLSTSDDGKSLIIYDAAISKLPNKSIKTGER
jgi:hypothetical protein